MNVIYRKAIPTDAARVADVYLASRRTFLPFAAPAHSETEIRQWISAVLIPAGEVTVASIDHEIIGMMALSRDGQLDWIEQLYLHPSVVGQGIGAQLLGLAMQELGSVIRLYTFQANVVSRRFYERHGFQALVFSDGLNNEERCPDVLYELEQRRPSQVPRLINLPELR